VLVLFLTAIFCAGVFYIVVGGKSGLSQAGYRFDLNGFNLDARYPHYALPPGVPVLHVYFIGDSYTFVNNLPLMLATVAASDTVNPVDIETGMVAVGNNTLDQLWQNHAAHDTLRSQHWDYVVLQEHSMQTLHPEWVQIMHTAMTNWNEEIRQAGAKPIVYITWARKPGSDWYDVNKYPGAGFGDPVSMQNQIDKVTNNFAAEISASIVPVGDYWATCGDQIGVPDFYNADGTHPSLAGDYLIALLFYRALTGHKPANVSYVAPGVSPEQTQLLIKCASYGG
jgi:hypothetical protein